MKELFNKYFPCTIDNFNSETAKICADINDIQNKIITQNKMIDECSKVIKEQQETIIQCDDVIKQQYELIQQLCKTQQSIQNAVRSEANIIKNALARQNPLPLLRFEVHLTDHCNLNCQNCDHFSPLAKENYVDVDVFEKDFTRLSELTSGRVERIFLLGGEPLLHPKVKDLIRITRKHFPYRETRVSLVTNGILLPNQTADFWNTCTEQDVEIAVTKYPVDIDFREIENTAKKYGTKYRYFGDSKVLKTSYHLPLDEKGMQDASMNFIRCWRANNCIFLSNGKLYPCVVPPNVKHFNEYFGKNIPVTDKDFVDIYAVNTIEEILEKLSKPFPFCRYCNVSGETKNHPWKQSKRDIQEWT